MKEFQNLYSNQIESPSLRPYAFIKFGAHANRENNMHISPSGARAETFIQKTKKLYVDTRAQRNLKILNDDLQDVHKIMTKNIQDVLHRGEKLDG
jgi:vesicle transport protein SEC22